MRLPLTRGRLTVEASGCHARNLGEAGMWRDRRDQRGRRGREGRGAKRGAAIYRERRERLR